MSLDALIFDVDGTLADTEEVHRQAFNAAFRAHGLPWTWDPERYRELLAVTGGKERLASFAEAQPAGDHRGRDVAELVAEVHATKTQWFTERIASGRVAPRPGVARLVAEARARGIRLAIATTTTPRNVEVLVPALLGEGALAWFDAIAAGDVVPRKKPAPDVYRRALTELGAPADRCVAFEDSEAGVGAARGAGLFTVAVAAPWTSHHDLSAANLVLPTLGDEAHPLTGADAARAGGAWLGLDGLAARHAAWVAASGPERGIPAC